MKRFLFFVFAITAYDCSAQLPGRASVHEPAPVIMDLNIRCLNEQIGFQTTNDFQEGKTISCYFHVYIKSNTPWLLSASTNQQTTMNRTEGAFVPVKIRDSRTGKLISLTENLQLVASSFNSLEECDFCLDLIVDPPFNAPEAHVNGLVNFQLSAQ